MRRALILTVATLVACGDTIDATQVMVVVDAQTAVRTRTEKLHVVVQGSAGRAGVEERDPYDRMFTGSKLEWPHRTGLAPLDGDVKRVYTFTATALDGDGKFVAQVRAISGYVKGKALELPLMLEAACIGIKCEADQTCSRGACKSARVDVSDLVGPGASGSSSDASVTSIDGGPVGDGGGVRPGDSGGLGAGGTGSHDAGADAAGPGGKDAGSDAGMEPMPVDECASPNVCTTEYPCQDLPVGYTCRGQFADWTPSDSPTSFTFTNGVPVVTDTRSGLMWQQGSSSTGLTWVNAKAYCSDLVLAGFEDWRLPTKAELESLVNFISGRTDMTVFPNSKGGWTSSLLAGSSDQAWTVDFSGTNAVGSSTWVVTSERTAKCVR